MAEILGMVTTSHVPSIGNAIAKKIQHNEYWGPFFNGFPPIHKWLNEKKPDVAVVFYNDHGLNFFLDTMPTFSVGAAQEYINEDEGWGIPTLPPYKGDASLSWQIIEGLVERDFDITTCQTMKVDHAFTLPLKLLWPDETRCPVITIPICINTVQFPLPSAKRCFELGKAVGEIIQKIDSDLKFLMVGTGGLSHQLDGERAGFINKDFDKEFMNSMLSNPHWATQFSNYELVEKVGTQGIELIMWLAARAALPGDVKPITSTYHVPISNTAGGIMLLENLAFCKGSEKHLALGEFASL
jgi:protocatechuate 4,5-dioxygenase beta chain